MQYSSPRLYPSSPGLPVSPAPTLSRKTSNEARSQSASYPMFALDNHQYQQQHDELVPSVREEESERGEEDQEDPSRFLLVKHANYSLRDLTLTLHGDLAFAKSLSAQRTLIGFYNLSEAIEAKKTLENSYFVNDLFVSRVLKGETPSWVLGNTGWIRIQGLASGSLWSCQKQLLEPFGPTKSIQQDKTAWLIEFFDLRDTASAVKGLHQLVLSDRSELDVGLYVKEGHGTLPGLFETTASSSTSASQQQDSLLLQSFDRLLSDANPYQPQTHSPFFEAPLPSLPSGPAQGNSSRHGSLGCSNSYTRLQANPGEEDHALAAGLWSPTQEFGGRLTPLPLTSPGQYMATTPLSTPPRSYSLKHDKILYEEEIMSLGERMGPTGPPSTPPQGLRSQDYFSWPSLPRSASSANQVSVYSGDRDGSKDLPLINANHSLGRPLKSPRSVSSSPMIQPHRLDHRSVSSSSFETMNSNNGNNQPDYQAIESGRDQRTTFMIRNIPNKYSQQMLIEFLNETHQGRFDFLYLRMDFKNKCNVGYAFINFPDPKAVISLADRILGKKWTRFNSDKIATICYANVQGRDALIEKFRNSSVMLEEPSFRPKVFMTSGPNAGEEAPFPMPSMRVRPKNDILFSRDGPVSESAQ